MQIANPPMLSLRELVDLARSAQGKIHHIYLHWTAGRYEQFKVAGGSLNALGGKNVASAAPVVFDYERRIEQWQLKK